MAEVGREAVIESKAKIILPINLINKLGHTTGWKVSNYVNNIEKYLGRLVDIILVNNEKPSSEQIERYKLKEGNGALVEDDFKDDRVIHNALLSHMISESITIDKSPNLRGFIKHDSEKLAECIKKIIDRIVLM